MFTQPQWKVYTVHTNPNVHILLVALEVFPWSELDASLPFQGWCCSLPRIAHWHRFDDLTKCVKKFAQPIERLISPLRGMMKPAGKTFIKWNTIFSAVLQITFLNFDVWRLGKNFVSSPQMEWRYIFQSKNTVCLFERFRAVVETSSSVLLEGPSNPWTGNLMVIKSFHHRPTKLSWGGAVYGMIIVYPS